MATWAYNNKEYITKPFDLWWSEPWHYQECDYKLLNTLLDMNTYFGDRNICVARELTKMHEEFFRTTITEAIAHFENIPPKGEFVLVIEGAKETEDNLFFEDLSVLEHISYYVKNGDTKKDAIKKVAQDRGVSKREIYAETIKND